MMHGEKTRLGVCCLGGAIGLLKGLFMLVIGLCAFMSVGWAVEMVHAIATICPWYHANTVGAVLGGAGWSFLCGFIEGALVAFFYNLFLCCCHSWCCKKAGTCETKHE